MAILIIALVLLLGFYVFRYYRQRLYMKVLTEDEFREGYRKAQLIDVRELHEFERGHILGARNIPVTQLRHYLTTLRKDRPVYLYCQGSVRATRAAQFLYKQGFRDLNILKGGFRNWTGKIKN